MSSNSSKSREEILAERLEKKKRKAALKNQNKDKSVNVIKESTDSSAVKKKESDTQISSSIKEVKNQKDADLTQSINETITSLVECPNSVGDSREKKQEKTDKNNVQQKLCSDITEGCKENANISEKEIIKTKAQLKAERRAKQEADRARKQEKAQGVPQEKKSLKAPGKVAEPSTAPIGKKELPNVGHKVKLFAHLYNIESDRDVVDASMEKVHPSITQLGAQYSSKVVSGANACCLALLNALKKVVLDFETPANQEFSRGLEAEISKSMANLSKYRPVAVSMVNAVKHLKYQVSQCKKNELECKNNLSEWIDTYIKEQLEMAAKAICLFVREKIAPGDVILTYGCSSLIQQILISVHNEGINFQVIVADGRPWLEGREMLKKLVSAGIHCTYVFVNGLSFIMPEVTKILLGAHALLANGYVMSRAGSSQIALLAKTYNVPVLVCCETHKFSERVQTDSFVYNELGNPDELASKKGCLSQELTKWKSIQFLTPLNLTYDITPPDLVSAVVTEIAVLPCTSVPVILRIKPPDVSC